MLAGDVVAVEANEARARELAENLRRLGRDDVHVVHADGRIYQAVRVVLRGEDRQEIESACRVVPGPEPLDERVRWAVRSALAEALRLARLPEARTTTEDG